MKINRDNIPKSYREYVEALIESKQMIEINDEVDWNLEMGAICRYGSEKKYPATIFNNVKGSPKGFRAAELGMGKSQDNNKEWSRLAIALGLPETAQLMEIYHAYSEAIESGEVHEPTVVANDTAPCKENIWLGDDIDLFKLPSPLCHDGDGGRYIQTAGVNIVQTPDGRWTNWSLNRAMIVNETTMTGLWSPAQHNGMIHKMWSEAGKNTPWALVLGASPTALAQSCARAPDWVDEYDNASRLLDASIEMVKCETNDLLVPADSEIIIEGYISKDEFELEGPFGEVAGYMNEERMLQPKQVVTAITFRNNPILPMCIPGAAIDSSVVLGSFFNALDTVQIFKESSLPVIDVFKPLETHSHWLVVRVYNDWHKRTGYSVEQLMDKIAHTYWDQHLGTCGKLIVVGEDIDPSSIEDVVWAFATRSHPMLGAFHYPDIKNIGTSIAIYNTQEEKLVSKQGGLVIYSCLELQEKVALDCKHIIKFDIHYPEPLRNKTRKSWEKWIK
ncbi:UbiD-like decarboxylase [Vibrio inusitatus NBRC 102082]|uniref:3-octaprenyl-4-hydroxybenzoate carboxy-lyase n=1 Tax=Vibrio inusitatus NBRC 102082 TaxID=1219070 RepID=A0A4Y3HWD9_9VIBR|nr:UbiD family decarboxylase [Vibrio inusitatus]GEA51503.1 UbiD-like decarboxylase [Vibrio inusitatus NBRC 102082]